MKVDEKPFDITRVTTKVYFVSLDEIETTPESLTPTEDLSTKQ